MGKKREEYSDDRSDEAGEAPPVGPLGMAAKEDRPTPDPPPTPAAERGRQGNAPACPYCSKFGTVVLCESNRSEAYFTRYYCPTKGCGFSLKVPRPDLEGRLRRDRQADDFSAR